MKDKYGFNTFINEHWEDDWKDIISSDQHYDGDYLIRLIVHKISLMLDYFETKVEQISRGELASDSNVTDVVMWLTMSLELGKKILTFNYGEKADKMKDEHGTMYWLSQPSDDIYYKKWVKLSEQAEAERSNDIERFFSIIGKSINNWWV